MALVGVGLAGGLLALLRRLFGFGGFWKRTPVSVAGWTRKPVSVGAIGGFEKSAELPR